MAAATLIVHADDLARDRISIEGDAHRHLFRARRIAPGERVRLVDGGGHARWGEVELVDRRHATLRLGDPAPSGEPSRQVELAVPPLRPERTGTLVEKATEVGVLAIRWYPAERTARDVGGAQLERWRRVARSAVEQSGRSRVPELVALASWHELERRVAECRSVILDPAAPDRLCDEPSAVDSDLAWLLVIGPEGGLTPTEIAILERCGARRARLGETVLRAETAAVVAAALVLCR